MKTLCIQYTPNTIYLSLAINQAVIDTKLFSVKELKTFIFHIESVLLASAVRLEEINTVCVNGGPAPAFTQRSLFALLNGIAFSLRSQGLGLSLYLIDDFRLLYQFYKKKNQENFVVALANAYSNDLFVLYFENNESKFSIMSLEECFLCLKRFSYDKIVHIIGYITESQEQFFSSKGFFINNNTIIEHTDYCVAALSEVKEKIGVEYLLPPYIKTHQIELNFEKR